MSPEPRTWVLSFDVADDRRRARLARLLESRGQRVQESVFEVLATLEGFDALLREVTRAECFDGSVDGVRAWPLCAACQPLARVLGAGPPLSVPGRPIVL